VSTPLLGMMMLLAGQAPPADLVCTPRPLPPAIDALPPLARSKVVTFGAAPSLEYPGGAWVVRLSQIARSGPAVVEIVQLRRQSNCNRYVIEKTWDASLPAEQFKALLSSLAAATTPPPDLFTADDPMRRAEDIVLDGTAVWLRVTDLDWEITRRRLNHYGRQGKVVSSIFYELVSRNVPPSELPSPAWTRKRAEPTGAAK
jgi:hypothetical protein